MNPNLELSVRQALAKKSKELKAMQVMRTEVIEDLQTINMLIG